MNTYADNNKENKKQQTHSIQKKDNGAASLPFVDSPSVAAQMQLQEIANNSPQVKQAVQLQAIANAHKATPVQKKANDTGLPDNLKSGIENLSGYSMDDVKVHYNSNKPAELQAHAYAQGTDIHLASGQEKHLPHEAWHVVQQKQGRVKPTLQMKGKVNVNDDSGLENEADVMGNEALQHVSDLSEIFAQKKLPETNNSSQSNQISQLRPVNQIGKTLSKITTTSLNKKGIYNQGQIFNSIAGNFLSKNQITAYETNKILTIWKERTGLLKQTNEGTIGHHRGFSTSNKNSDRDFKIPSPVLKIKKKYSKGQMTNTALSYAIKGRSIPRNKILTHGTEKVRTTLRGETDQSKKTNSGTTGDLVHFHSGIENTYGEIVYVFNNDDVGAFMRNGDYIKLGEVDTADSIGYYTREQYKDVIKRMQSGKDLEEE